MRNLVTTVAILFLLTGFFSCKRNDEVDLLKAHADLTRNSNDKIGWHFRLPDIDSISSSGIPYFKPFPENYNWVIYSTFRLQSIDAENRLYLRYTDHWDYLTGGDWRTYIDTIRIQKDRGNSIICRMTRYEHGSATPDSPGYYGFTFYGKYNAESGNIEGYVDTMSYSYRCITCPGPGSVYFSFKGRVQAVITPM